MERNSQLSMFVTKRNGDREEVSFDKVIWRLKKMSLIEPKLENINILDK